MNDEVGQPIIEVSPVPTSSSSFSTCNSFQILARPPIRKDSVGPANPDHLLNVNDNDEADITSHPVENDKAVFIEHATDFVEDPLQRNRKGKKSSKSKKASKQGPKPRVSEDCPKNIVS